MSRTRVFLIDSDVLITAKNLYYAFDICPGFWKSLVHHHQAGQVQSIDRVRSELLAARKTEDLVQWVKNEVPREFFLPIDTHEVADAYREIMLWIWQHSRYFKAAKDKFAKGADGWLVACAQVHGAIVVTNERNAPESKRQVKLPDVCAEFGVQTTNTFSMLRTLGVQFDRAGCG